MNALWLAALSLFLLLVAGSFYWFRVIRARLLGKGYRIRRLALTPYVLRAQRSYVEAAASNGWSRVPMYGYWVSLLTGGVLWFAVWLSPTGRRVLTALQNLFRK